MGYFSKKFKKIMVAQTDQLIEVAGREHFTRNNEPE